MNNEIDPTVKSPCIDNCCLDDVDICLGCFRSLNEILAWSSSTDQQRNEILELTAHRRHDHQLRYKRKND